MDHGWTLILAATAASVAGSGCIGIDWFWNKLTGGHNSLLHSQHFFVATFSLSSGVLMTTALYSLLPSALSYFQQSNDSSSNRTTGIHLLIAFTVGVSLCSLMSLIVHVFTSKSVVHCAHDFSSNPAGPHRHHDYGSVNQPEFTGARVEETMHSSPPHFHPMYMDEHSPLLESHIEQHFSTKSKHHDDDGKRPSLIDRARMAFRLRHMSVGDCAGFRPLQRCASEIYASHHHSQDEHNTSDSESCEIMTPFVYHDDPLHPCSNDDTSHVEVHHHHVVTKFSQLVSTGLQTALAITIHKIPEGVLMFATNHADTKLAFNIFVALAIHNFGEGFSIAAPLYLAMKSRMLAFLVACMLGGGAFPLGGFLGYWLFSNSGVGLSLYYTFGWLFAGAAGFMVVTALQMILSSILFGGSLQATIFWALIGIILALASDCLTDI